MMKTAWVATVVLAGSAAAQTGEAGKPMSVETYLERHQSIETRMKALEPDLKAMARVTEQAIAAYRADAVAAREAGRPPRGCLPTPGSQIKLSGAEVLAALQATPNGERNGSVQDAIFAFFDRRFPCAGAEAGRTTGPPGR